MQQHQVHVIGVKILQSPGQGVLRALDRHVLGVDLRIHTRSELAAAFNTIEVERSQLVSSLHLAIFEQHEKCPPSGQLGSLLFLAIGDQNGVLRLTPGADEIQRWADPLNSRCAWMTIGLDGLPAQQVFALD